MYNIAELPGSIRAQILRAGLPMKTIGREFSDLDPSDALDTVRQWVELVKDGKVIQNPGSPQCGLGIMLVGEPGHGKTTLACTGLQELIRGISKDVLGSPEKLPPRVGGFMDYPKLLRLQKAQWSEPDEAAQLQLDSIYGDADKMNNTRVFILDDLGKEHRTATGWAENTFDALLRSRFNAGLPTIVTTNVPLKNWGVVYGEPMGSFAHEAFIPIAVKAPGGDRRR
jgi:DNA replication protein DnaC